MSIQMSVWIKDLQEQALRFETRLAEVEAALKELKAALEKLSPPRRM